MRTLFLAITATGLALGTLARAEGQRDAFECAVLRTCLVGQPCSDGGETFGLTFIGGGLEITMNGETLHPAYSGDLRTADWQAAGRTYQLRFTGDAGGIATVTPTDGGEFAQTAVLWLHCSPA